MHSTVAPWTVLRACWHGAMQLHYQVLHALNVCTALWLSRAVLRTCWHGAMHLHCQSSACLECTHSIVAPWSRAASLLARCNACALPCFAYVECMHSTMSLSSRAVCLLARCNAFALPKFCMLGVHAQHC